MPGRREHDQVFVAAALEEGRQIGGLALIKRQERLHCFVVGESHHHNRRGGHRLRSGHEGVSLAKLLQARGKFVNVPGRAATVDVEMRGARLEPLPLHQRKVIRLGGGGAKPRFQKHGQKQATNHKQIQFKG